MAYVINEPCIGTKDTSCVEVCPVDCIHPTADEPGFEAADQLYIDPEECIDCDACVEACPVDAITSDDMVPPEWHEYIERNAAYYRGTAHDLRRHLPSRRRLVALIVPGDGPHLVVPYRSLTESMRPRVSIADELALCLTMLDQDPDLRASRAARRTRVLERWIAQRAPPGPAA